MWSEKKKGAACLFQCDNKPTCYHTEWGNGKEGSICPNCNVGTMKFTGTFMDLDKRDDAERKGLLDDPDYYPD